MPTDPTKPTDSGKLATPERVKCTFSGFALCLITKTALLLPLGQEVEVGPE